MQALYQFDRGSLRLTCARRRPDSRFCLDCSFAASLICTLLTTWRAPAVFAMRVAVPLCCMISVLPSIVAVPPDTRTVNLSVLIFDLANLARIAASSWGSVKLGGGFLERVWTGAAGAVLAGDCFCCCAPARIENTTNEKRSFTMPI